MMMSLASQEQKVNVNSKGGGVVGKLHKPKIG